MRFVAADTEGEIEAVTGAIAKHPESWKNWRCMTLEVLEGKRPGQRKTLNEGIGKIIDIYLQGKQGTAFLPDTGMIVIFCKDVSEMAFATMGRRMIDLAKSSGVAAFDRTYDLDADMESFLASRAVRGSTQTQPELPLTRSSAASGKSDELSLLGALKVLLVEDDPVTRWLVKMTLKDECRLAVAPDAGKAIATYMHYKPDLVLLDINLPGHNGYEVMARIMDSDPGAYIVMFSSQDSLENMVGAMTLGAKGFIAKPFDKERLVGCVHACHGSR